MDEKRGNFSGKLGFILTAAAAAIGLGCIWRFPTHVAECGGGLSILLYIIFLALFGIPMLILEFAIGRKTGSGAIEAFGKLNPKMKFVGVMAIIAIALIQPYFSVLGGSITKFSVLFLSGQGLNEGFINSYVLGFEPIIWTTIFIVITSIVVILGVQKGIERLCKILLPIEALILVGLAIFIFTIPGIGDGIAYYLTPNFSALSPSVILTVMGQVLFSLSLGMGIMITLGSYTSKKENLVSSTVTIAVSTLGVALVAGLIIVPIGFLVTGGDPGILGSGNMFLSMSLLFENMPMGFIVGAIFFVLLFFAALLSNVCGMEALVCAFREKFKWSRVKTVIILTIAILIVAIPISLHNGVLGDITLFGKDLLDLFDYVSGTLILPIVILLTCICVGFCTNTHHVLDEIKLSSKLKVEKPYIFLIRFIIPIVIGLVFIFGIITEL